MDVIESHVCVDIETLGNHPERGVMLSIGAVAFTMDMPLEPLDLSEYVSLPTQYYSIIALKEQVEKYKWEIEPETLSWWLHEPKRAKLLCGQLSSSTAESIGVVLTEFKEWIKKIHESYESQHVFLWSHGATFDCMHLSQKWPQILHESFSNVYPFRNMRDTRTLFALYNAKVGSDVPKVEGMMSHHALADAWRTATQIQMAWNALKGQPL